MEFSITLKKYLLRKVLQVQDTTRKSVLVSRPHKQQWKANTLTISAHSPQMLPSEAESLRVSSFPQRWLELWFLEEITCITSRNTTDLKRDITTCQHISPQLSAEPESVISSLSVNADQSPRPSDSMLSELRSKELKVTLERLLSCSEHELWQISPKLHKSHWATPSQSGNEIQLAKFARGPRWEIWLSIKTYNEFKWISEWLWGNS